MASALAPAAVPRSIFDRQAWVGFAGGFGLVKIGKIFSPYDEVKGIGAGGFNEIFAPANGNVWASNSYNANPSNSIYYSTPDIAGFSAAASYALGENKTATVNAGRVISGNAKYAGGPIVVALSHQQEKADGNATAVKFTQLNAAYDFQVIKVRAAYGQVKNGTSTLFAVAPATTAFSKSREYQVGVDVPLGAALTLSTGVARSKLTIAGGEVKSTGFGLAAKYDLSKRTFLYTGLQAAKNDGPGSNEIRTDVFAAGVQHKF